jgi:hypothetical protein
MDRKMCFPYVKDNGFELNNSEKGLSCTILAFQNPVVLEKNVIIPRHKGS